MAWTFRRRRGESADSLVGFGGMPGRGRSRPICTSSAALAVVALSLVLASCTKTATHEPGAYTYDAIEQSGAGTYASSQDEAPPYAGSWVGKAHLGAQPGSGSHGRGIFGVAPSAGSAGIYGAAFFFPAGTFSGPDPKQQGTLDVMGWDVGGGAEYGGIRIGPDHSARLVRARSGQEDAIGSPFSFQEGCWNWLVVKQGLLSDRPAGDPFQASSEVYLNGEKIVDSHAPNNFGNSFGHWAEQVRFGIVTVDTEAQQSDLDFYLDDSYVSTYRLDPPTSRACDPQGDPEPPAIDPTAPTPFSDQTEFLYSGEFPVQHGVEDGTIEPKRAAVLRGRVLSRSGAPLPDVRVIAPDHPEYGFTTTRPDGNFYLAANGGGEVRIRFEKEGYLPLERTLDVPWQDYAFSDDVVLTPLDASTDIDLDSPDPIQVARGSPVTDSDGTRQATLLFPQGTQATMTLPDNSTVPLANPLRVRATEYTVGSTGPEAMPAELPATSGYTYAVDYTVDRALDAGAKRVSFSQPIPSYVENFVGIPVGEPVPTAYYDSDRGAWVAIDSGRVVKLHSEAGGIAELEIDDSGEAATPSQLQQLGITDDERRTLSDLYDTGDELWRVPLDHFSPQDENLRVLPVPGSEGPPGTLGPPRVIDQPCHQPGSVIECENRALGEDLDVTGTPFSLHYQSDRQPGWKVLKRFEVPVSGASVPGPLVRIDVEAELAGRHFSQSLPPQPNQVFTFDWDGKDAFGRTLRGAQPVKLQVAYVFPALYAGASRFGQSDGQPYSVSSRDEVPIFRTYRDTIGGWDASDEGLGGWTIDVHHVYDPASQTLYLGDGSRRSAQSVNRVIETAAGTGDGGVGGEGEPARQTIVEQPTAVAAAPDGSYYFAERHNHRVRKVDRDGVVSTVAGVTQNGIPQAGYNGDDRPATQALLQNPSDVELGPDGSLYIADQANYRIRKVSPQGVISTIAGTGLPGYTGDDGTPATASRIQLVYGIALAPDGSLYFTQEGSVGQNAYVRRVTTDGRTELVVGPSANLADPLGIDVAPNGDVYFAESGANRQRVLKVLAKGGCCDLVAGTGVRGHSGDGGPATSAQLRGPSDVAIAPDGSVYILEDTEFLRHVTPDGTITTIAGGGPPGTLGDGGAAKQGFINTPRGLALAPDNSILIAELGDNRIRRVRPPLPGFDGTQLAVPSEDGSELYRFDQRGRHLATLDTHTGATLYGFSYDSAGRLASITDGDDNVTQVQRDSQGQPTAIVAPFGQHTTLGLDGNGFLNQVTNPESEQTQLGYTSDGLLETLTDPRNGLKEYHYDSLGRLERADDQGAGSKMLSRTTTTGSYETTLTTKLGRASKYKVEQLASGDIRRTHTDEAGLQSTLRQDQDATNTATATDGTVTTLRRGPDPRFGMNASILQSMSVATPGGRDLSLTGSRQISPPDLTDPLSLQGETDTLNVNGRSYTTAFDRSQSRFTTTSPESRTTATDVDHQGRPTRQEVSGITPLVSTYKPNGLLESQTQGSRSWGYTYEPSGFLDTITDPLGRLTTFDYDGAGRVTRQTLPGSRQIDYGHDDNGNLTSVTPPSRPAHAFTHTPVDLLETYTAPPVAGDPYTTSYSYNDDQQLELITRPDGTQIDLDYGAQTGRLEHLSTARGVTDLSYDPQTGNLSSITAPGNEQIAFQYDGSLPTSETFSGTVSGSVNRTYDDDLRIDSSSVNGAHTVDYGYDDDSLLTSAGALTLERDPQNGLISGTALGNTTTSLTYNAFAEPDSLTANFGTDTLYAATYSPRDNGGRIETRTETSSQGTHTYTYTYDPQTGFLREVRKDGVLISTYGYDDNGNRTSALTDGVAKTGTYDDQDRLTSYGPNTYTYTAAGELHMKMTGSQMTTYNYDALGSLENVDLPDGTAIDYVNDGYGRRIAKKRDGNLVQGFLYGEEALGPVAEFDSAGNVESRFAYATRSNVPDYMTKGGNTYRVFADDLGSPRIIVDANSGQVAQELDYDEFGNVVRDSNPGFQPFGFAGGIYDRDTKLVRLGARDFEPEVGRWTTKDPTLFGGGDTNVFGYVFDDPINLVDPAGTLGLPSFMNVSNVAAGALNGLTLGVSNKLAGVDGSCAGSGYGFGSILGEAAGVLVPGAGVVKVGKIARAGRAAKAAPEGADLARLPVGRHGGPIEIKPGTNTARDIGGRPYSGHALDRMQGRGIPPSAVEDAIANGQSVAARGGTTIHYSAENHISVVVGRNGRVVTVGYGRFTP